jgi:starch-binding outer membrane protein, SusD/RagB family
MKSIFNLFIVCGALFSLENCTKFLEREPISELAEGNFYKTGADAEAGLVAAYDVLQNEYYIFDRFTNGDVVSDNCYAGGDNPMNFQLDEFKTTALNANVERDWRYLYEAISRANAVLDNVEAIQSTDLSAERKRQILGEAAFLRAMHYFHLVNLYGDVPLILKKVNSTDVSVVNQPRIPVAQIYESIVADLIFSLDRVPESYPQGAQRVTKGAVNALLAKAFAHQPTPDWSKVDGYCEAVVNNPNYSLLPQFAFLWNGQNENSKESIFETQFVGGTNEANWGPQLWLPPLITGDNWRKFNTPSNDLLTAFITAGDDGRKSASIYFQTNLPWQDPNYPSGMIPFPFKQRVAAGWSSPNNFILLRLADLILLQAEAKTELNNLDLAKNLLNKVRTRANLTNTIADSQETLRTAIALERRLELAFEGHRWFDLKRTGKAVETMNALGKNYNITADRLLFPIPQTELDRNPELVQNPGY